MDNYKVIWLILGKLTTFEVTKSYPHVFKCMCSEATCIQMYVFRSHMYSNVCVQRPHAFKCMCSEATCIKMYVFRGHMYSNVCVQRSHVFKCMCSEVTCIQMYVFRSRRMYLITKYLNTFEVFKYFCCDFKHIFNPLSWKWK